MEWIADSSAGSWLRERLDEKHETMHGVVPRGFRAYARVFHPASVRSLPGRAMPSWDELDRMPDSDRDALFGQYVDEPATWAEAAAAYGTVLHPQAQWGRIVRTPAGDDWRSRIAPDGRQFDAPGEGEMEPALLAAIARHLVGHTSTPDAGFAAVWEGWGGLIGHLGRTATPALMSDDPAHLEMLQRSIHDPFNDAFRKPRWLPGILSDEVSNGPRLELPDREYVLFSAAPSAFADPHWILDAPWRNVESERQGFPPSAQHPSILWPADRAWVLVSEIDFDSTVIAGSPALVAAICADPDIEALPLPENARLTWDADEVNR
ncbi:hypothetical protein [Microbacterium sp. NPDC058345]|uniref:hypothetical protein n=1 Tax=Microbacterium sp. NPDC058345 TaxID=3346455 RepID=UPI0036534CB5